MVGLAHNAAQDFVALQARQHGGRPAFLLGSLERPGLATFNRLLSRFDSLHRPAIRHVRRDRSVRSRRWLASDVLGPQWDHAISLVEFDAGMDDATLLTYEHSDRLVIVLDGRGSLYTTTATLEEVAKTGFGEITSHQLEPGCAALLTRGCVHSFAGHEERSLTLLVCHLPYITPSDERYSTTAKWLTMATMWDIRDVFRDRDMLTVMYLVNQGTRTSVDLCTLMHRDQATLEVLGERLESIRMIARNDAGGWSLHPTVSMCEKDGKIEIAREELGYRVEQRAPRVT
ncbi:MAG: hypothetical protein RLN60_02130 [Phycisphaerales bacterium]